MILIYIYYHFNRIFLIFLRLNNQSTDSIIFLSDIADDKILIPTIIRIKVPIYLLQIK